MYLERARGCRVWDVDGHEYIDYLMAFGPFLLGYAHPDVDRAATATLETGRLMSMNHRLHIEFIEALLARFPGNEMGVFFRSGSEATTAALRMARRATGRRRVARCGYHGWHDWCLPTESFVPSGLGEQVLEFRADEPASLAAMFDRYSGEIAAVILAPEMVLPHDPAIFHTIAEMTRAAGAVFIMDEVKTGLRISPGTISQRIGLDPDLLTLSKALGNGWAVAAVLGKRAVMEAASGMHLSGTFHGDLAAMSAALEVLDIVERTGAAEHAWAMGERLIAGLRSIAADRGVPVQVFGEPLPPMPFMRFDIAAPDALERVRARFFEVALERGVLLHPRHMWFTSLAHTSADLTRTLEVADRAMQEASRALV